MRVGVQVLAPSFLDGKKLQQKKMLKKTRADRAIEPKTKSARYSCNCTWYANKTIRLLLPSLSFSSRQYLSLSFAKTYNFRPAQPLTHTHNQIISFSYRWYVNKLLLFHISQTLLASLLLIKTCMESNYHFQFERLKPFKKIHTKLYFFFISPNFCLLTFN